MSGAFPISTAKFGTLGIKSIQNSIISKSVSGKRLVRQIDNQRFAFTVQIITGTRSSTYGELMAFIMKQRGQKETFTIIPPEVEDARGNESGTVLVNGVHAVGDTTIAMDGHHNDNPHAFKAGDFIDAQGYSGTVSEIQIFNTILKTPDNKTIIIPNGGLSTGAMTNYSSEPLRRVDWTVGIGYGDDVDQARSVLLKMCETDPRILKDPALFIGVSALADSSVNFAVRAWVKAEDYWGVFFDLNENIYKTFNKEGLHIPFPQMDVHVHNAK